jgi:alkylated DNA repair dioxygenase AlkB
MPPERTKDAKSGVRDQNIPRNKASKPPRARKVIPNDDKNPIFKQITNPSLDEYRLPMLDANVYYIPHLLEPSITKTWYESLSNLSTWYRPTLKVYGKSILQSREIAAYATDPNLTVKYSGALVNLHCDYPEVISTIQTVVEQKLGVKFNHVMLNRYDSGDVYIGLHADNLENRVIATVGLGVERTFVMRHRTRKGEEGMRKWKLGDGSLFVMQGETQRFWKHEIPKEPKIREGRISLTFRQLVF